MNIHNNSRPLLQHSSSDDENISREEELLETTINRLNQQHNDDDDGDDEDLSGQMTTELLRNETVPTDKYSFNYAIFYLLGMTMMMPWNFFITAEDVSVLASIPQVILSALTSFA